MSGAPSSRLPLQLLAILPIQRQGEWLDACLMCGGGDDIEITQVSTPHDAAALLRQYSFDMLVFWIEGAAEPERAAWSQLAQLTGHDGFVALGMQVREGWHAPLFEAGALACLDMDATDPITLVHTLRSSGELLRLREASGEWAAERQRIQQREAREVDRLLEGQRSLLSRLDQLGGGPSTLSDEPLGAMSSTAGEQRHSADSLASPLGQSYCLALQNFLFDESENAGATVAHLAELFMVAGASSSGIMRVHLAAVTQVTSRGGAGTLRHCLAGADRFLMELLMRMVDSQQPTPASASHAPRRLHARVSPLAAA
jgi:hypothetical protein